MFVDHKNLKVLLDRRNKYLDKYEDSYDEKSFRYTIKEPKEIDDIADEIILYIKKHRNDLDVECIIEVFTHLGSAPNLLYDDNGHFAIEDEGFQSISEEIDDVEMSFLVKKDKWKPTIKEAINYYINNY